MKSHASVDGSRAQIDVSEVIITHPISCWSEGHTKTKRKTSLYKDCDEAETFRVCSHFTSLCSNQNCKWPKDTTVWVFRKWWVDLDLGSTWLDMMDQNNASSQFTCLHYTPCRHLFTAPCFLFNLVPVSVSGQPVWFSHFNQTIPEYTWKQTRNYIFFKRTWSNTAGLISPLMKST